MTDHFDLTPPPWTPEQIAHLQSWQTRPPLGVPTYTCGGTDTTAHPREQLTPTATGWHCPAANCDRQTFPGTFAGLTNGSLRTELSTAAADLRAYAGEGPLADTQVQLDANEFWLVLGLTDEDGYQYTGMSCLLPTEIAVDWAVREYPAAMLDGAGHPDLAEQLRALPEITGRRLDQRTGLRNHSTAARAVNLALSESTPAPTDVSREAVTALIDWAAPAPGLASATAYDVLLGSGRSRTGAPGIWAWRIVRNLYDNADDDSARLALAHVANTALDDLLQAANDRAREGIDRYQSITPTRLVLTPEEV